MGASDQEELTLQPEELRIREEADRNYGSGFEGYEYYEAGGTDEVEAVIKRLKTRDQQRGEQILKDAEFDKLRSFRDQSRIPVFADQISPLKRKSMWLLPRKNFSRKLKNFGVLRRKWEQTDDGREWTEEIQRLDAVLDKKEEDLDAEEDYRDRISSEIITRGQFCQSFRNKADSRLDEVTAGKQELQDRFQYQGAADPDEMDRRFDFVHSGETEANPARKEFVMAELAMSDADMEILKHSNNPLVDYKDLARVYTGKMSGLFNIPLREGRDIGNPMLLRQGLSGLRINRDLVTRRGVTGVECLAHMIGIEDENDPETGLPLTEERLMELFRQKMAQHPEGLVIRDKGFFSTAFKDNGAFPAVAHPVGPNLPVPHIASTRGIEFIVLVRKGTCAADVRTVTQIPTEWEVLVNAGTQFRVVQAFFNTDAPGDRRKIFSGDAKSWKIYLETIPPEEDGTERDDED